MLDEEWQAFLAAIVANPDADLPRLIFADFLDERGNGPRADRIRHGCNNPGARYSCWGDESVGLICCEASPCPLCDDLHGEGVPWSLLGESRYHVRRGFVAEITISWQNWIGGSRCENCDGQGHTNLRRDLRSGDPLWEHYVCSDCNGTGTGVPNHAAILASCPIRRVNRRTECKYCIGRGRSMTVEGRQPCPTCQGAGKLDDWRGDGLVRLTTWPEWEGDSRGDEYLRLHGCKRWHRIPFADLPNGSARATIVGKLLTAEWPKLDFDLSRLRRDGFDPAQPGGDGTVTGDMTWEPNVREWLDAHTTA